MFWTRTLFPPLLLLTTLTYVWKMILKPPVKGRAINLLALHGKLTSCQVRTHIQDA